MKHIFLAMTLLWTTPLFSESVDLEGSAESNSSYDQCARYSGYPQYCNPDFGCTYDYRSGRCYEGGGYPENCRAYDYNPHMCNSTGTCAYDYAYNVCRNNRNDPNNCSVHYNQPWRCNQTFGCFFDQGSRQCLPNRGGDRLLRVNLNCGSSRYGVSRCPVNGLIVRANVLAVHSSANCIYGQSWGWQDNFIWVDRGCRADFQVDYRSRY